MKVKDLIKILEKTDGDLDVYCTSNVGGDNYEYGKVHTAKPMCLTMEDSGQQEEFVFVIDEV